jgi:cell division protein FtsB
LNFRFSPRRAVYALAVLIVLLAAYSIVGERGALHLWRLRAEKFGLDEKNFRLQKENEALRQRVARLRHDDSYLEQIAREELNLVRRGEIIYRFASKADPGGRGNAPTGSSAAPPPREARK